MTPHARIISTLVIIFGLMAVEARRSARNERALRARGAVEPPSDVYAWMRIVYPLAFIAPAVEGWLRVADPREWWLAGLVAFAVAKGLKYWAVRSLADRWSFRVLVVPGAPLVTRGPYRFLSHPNYLAVAGEIAGAALLVGGPRTGALFTILFGWLMLRRITVEERALQVPKPSAEPARLPRWAGWFDALSVTLLLIALKVAVSSGLRASAFGQLITVRQAWRPALVALALMAFRHWRAPRPHLVQRIWEALGAARRRPYADIVRIWAVSRFGVVIAGAVAVLIIGRPPTMEYRVSNDLLADLPGRWDAGWYAAIAQEGYRDRARAGERAQQAVAFFPAYPMLLRAASVFTEPQRVADMTYDRYIELRQSRLVWAGLLIAVAIFLPALVALYRWMEARSTPDAALATVVFLSAYPFAVFYSAPYTESLFLFSAVSACLAFERGRWLAAAAAGLLAGLTRPNGAMLSLTLGLIAIAPLLARDRRASIRELPGRLLVAAMPGAGMLAFSAYTYSLSGDPFAWMKVQEAWGRSFAGSMAYAEWVVVTVWHDGLLAWVRRSPAEFIQTLAALFALGMTWPVYRRLGAPYAVFMLANLLPPLFKGGVLSIGRLTSTLFPMFAALALIVPPSRRAGWLLLFALGQGLIAALFFTWRPVY